MLPNGIILKKPYLVGTVSVPEQEASLVDVDNGRSVRRLNVSPTEFIELTVGRQASQENGSEVPTTRFVVRIDRNLFLSTLQKPRWIKQASYLVVTRPSHASFTDNDICDLAGRLVGILMGAGNAFDWGSSEPLIGDAANVNDYAAFKTGLVRILTGEL